MMCYTPVVREMTKLTMWLTMTNLKTREGRRSVLNQQLLMQFPNLVLTQGLSTHIADQNHSDVVNIGSNPTIANLDSYSFLYKSINDKLLLSYHDSSFDSFIGFAFPEVFYFENAGIPFDIANNFEDISFQDCSDSMDYLNFHNQVTHRNNNSSENHTGVDTFVGYCPYLLYYHLWLLHVPCLQNCAAATLLVAVVQDSLSPYLSTKCSANHKSKKRLAGRSNKAVMSALEEIEIGNGERIRYMRERNDNK
jgi:hypothetical protein